MVAKPYQPQAAAPQGAAPQNAQPVKKAEVTQEQKATSNT